eukprot:1196112-Prorocentrum_minimum.AAC.9
MEAGFGSPGNGGSVRIAWSWRQGSDRLVIEAGVGSPSHGGRGSDRLVMEAGFPGRAWGREALRREALRRGGWGPHQRRDGAERVAAVVPRVGYQHLRVHLHAHAVRALEGELLRGGQRAPVVSARSRAGG